MKSFFLSTYTQILLSDQPLLQELLLHYSRTSKPDAPASSVSPKEPLIQMTEFNESLRGPYAPFFTHFFANLALLIRMQIEFTFKDEAFSQGEYQHERKKISDENLANVPESMLVAAKKEFEVSLKKYAESWEKLSQSSAQAIIQNLKDAEVSFTDSEIQEISTYETVTDLLNRCAELKLVLPKELEGKTEFSFENYFLLKSLLLLESSLSRSHLPHDAVELEKYLKMLRKTFKEIAKNTAELEDTEKGELEKITEPLSFLKDVFKV